MLNDGLLKSWNRRFINLNQFSIYVYKFPGDSEPTLDIPLSQVDAVERTDEKQYSFEIKVQDRCYSFECSTDEEVYEWMDEIYKV